MDIPGLGHTTRDEQLGWYRSKVLPVAALGGAMCHLVVDGYDDDPSKDEVHAVISTFLALDDSALRAAASPIFDYYQDMRSTFGSDDDWDLEISEPDAVWHHIHAGEDLIVARDSYGDRKVYVSVECECDWEPEHGLQIVFREGRTVTKVGPYNGHLTNAAADARADLADIVHVRRG